MAAAATLLLLIDRAPGWTASVLATAGAVAGGGLLLVVIAARVLDATAPGSAADAGAGRVKRVAVRQLRALREGLRHISAPLTMLQLAGTSAAIILASALTNLLTMRAFDLAVPPAAALLMLVLVQSGNAVVGAPGGVGVSQFLAVEALGLWGVPPAAALAYSLALFAIVRLPKIAMVPVALAALSAAPPVVVPSAEP
jgi:uncharacterized membrane protein YbhN (UPF0104 family)